MALLLTGCGAVQAAPRQAIQVTTGSGETVTLEPQELTGLKSRPLVKVKESLDARFGTDFFTLPKITVKAGTELVGRCTVQKAPVRLTVYEISKKKDTPFTKDALSSSRHKRLSWNPLRNLGCGVASFLPALVFPQVRHKLKRAAPDGDGEMDRNRHRGEPSDRMRWGLWLKRTQS